MFSNGSSNEVSTHKRDTTVHFGEEIVSCRDVENLYMAYRDGELPASLHTQVAEHIVGCEECQMMVDTYELVVSVARTLQSPVAPKEGYQDRLRQALKQRLGV